MVVDLPWSTTITVTVTEDRSTAFEVAAFNEEDSGELTCAANWKQADGDGNWDRSSSYLVPCAGDFSFRDDGEVRLEPTGRSVSFDGRDERIAEIAEAKRVETERIAMVEDAAAAAAPPGPVELDGWSVELTGVDRDAADLLEAYSPQNNFRGSNRAVLTEVTATRIADEPGRASDIEIGALGGYDLAVYDADNDDCGPHVPNSYLAIYGLIDEQQPGDEVVFNTCLVLDEADAEQAIAVISVFLGDNTPVTMRFPSSGPTGTGPEPAEQGNTVEFAGFDTAFDLEVVGATIDDVDLLIERLGEEVRPPVSGRSYVMVDIALTNQDPADLGPVGPTWGVDWTLLSADGTKLYDWTDYCPKVFDLFTATPPPEGGIDWNFGDDHLLAFPGETKTFVACFEVEAEDVAGSIIQIGQSGDEPVALATGL